MQGRYPEWPRIEMHNAQVSEVYYTPIVTDTAQRADLTKHVLELLNQDPGFPPVKITQIAIRADYRSSEDTLTGYTMVEFPLFAGIEKRISVKSSVPLARYTALH
jgi:hypothetical protein